jgi:hypothetical protein
MEAPTKERFDRALADLATIIEDAYGKRCPDYDYGCATCIAWKTLDDMKKIIEEAA